MDIASLLTAADFTKIANTLGISEDTTRSAIGIALPKISESLHSGSSRGASGMISSLLNSITGNRTQTTAATPPGGLIEGLLGRPGLDALTQEISIALGLDTATTVSLLNIAAQIISQRFQATTGSSILGGLKRIANLS